MSARLVHAVDYLAPGDGVSAVVRGLAALSPGGARPEPIVARWVAPPLRAGTVEADAGRFGPADTCIYHVAGPTGLARFFADFPGRRLLYFHNVTPPGYFPRGSRLHHETLRAWREIPPVAAAAERWLAPSAYNLGALARLAGVRRVGHVVPPAIDAEAERRAPADAPAEHALRAAGGPNVLFVGRLSPNKAQDRLVLAFDRFRATAAPGSRLHLVGSVLGAPLFARQVERLRDGLPCADAVVLTGMVPDEVLRAHYRAADLFVCCSDHEGFCLPPIVAAAHGVPVVATAAAALAETVAPFAEVVRQAEPEGIAAAMARVHGDPAVRERLVSAGRRHLEALAPAAVERRLAAALAA